MFLLAGVLFSVAASAAAQSCTPDWNKCGWQASSTTSCCSPEFQCQKKNDWYWQCVKKKAPGPPAAAAAAAVPPPAAPLPPVPLVTTPAPPEYFQVKKQMAALEGSDLQQVTSEVSQLSSLAAKLSAEGAAAQRLAVQIQEQSTAPHQLESPTDLLVESDRLSRLSADLQKTAGQMMNASNAASAKAQAVFERVSHFSHDASEAAQLAAKLPGANKTKVDQRLSVKVLAPAQLPGSSAAVSHPSESCPDNADLNKCISWCNAVAPQSTPTLAGHVCTQRSSDEVGFGMLPQCKCYDGNSEKVLKECSSSCPEMEHPEGSALAKALDGVRKEMDSRQKTPIDVAVLYSTHCSACRNFISHGLSQLVHAGLPGREVNVSLLPMDAGSAMARTQLCALKQTQMEPTAMDRPSFKKGLDYLVCCDLGGGVDKGTALRCAAETGFDWAKLEQCAEGPEGKEMAMVASQATARVQDVLKGRGFQKPPGIPWVFVQGTLLRCSGVMCSHEILPGVPGQLTDGLHEGARPLSPGGGAVGFVQYVCSRLSPQPQGCLAAAPPAQPVATGNSDPKACENCFLDMGHPLEMHASRTGLSARVSLLAAVACLVIAGSALVAVVVRSGLVRGERAEQGQPTFSPLAEGEAASRSREAV